MSAEERNSVHEADDDWLDSALRSSAGPPIPDDGFTAGVVRRIVSDGVVSLDGGVAVNLFLARRRAEHRRMRIVAVGAVVGTALALLTALAVLAGADPAQLLSPAAMLRQGIGALAALTILAFASHRGGLR
jgi:hypothetical protein